ncbi:MULTISPECIES: diacylglycerol/lipid kinase family protein [Streptomyces]|uniref:Diacylglycerol kinase family protein n=2 Tax=Streptomyces TaxID=1883 RepID=A0ABU4KCM8_9ACTN|nr:diacylglycerol kinase family protein [Streptomyces roseolus]MDX2295530.1 diacylglycerol kinase family protein [Streptomyces roseolus]
MDGAVRWRGEGEAAGAVRDLARWALGAAAGAVLVLLLAVGSGGFLVLASGLVGLAAGAAGLWWVAAHRGALRVAGGVLAIGAPVGVLVLYVVGGLWLFALAALALWVLALGCAREALRRPGEVVDVPAPARPGARPRQAVLFMNPKSGGGKVGRFGLVAKAERLGARVVLLDPSAPVDVTALARKAVADGADLLGVAGGDGTQALVAAVAAEHDLPFLVVSAGTRNHFAMDLGLDRNDPAAGLDALTDGEELRVDLGTVSGRPFVNTVSFGVYADVVQRPEYRDAKAETAFDALPDLLRGGQGDRLDATVDGTRLPGRQAILVSNNPYAAPDLFSAATGHRTRLDGGRLGVIGIRVDSAAHAADLVVRGTQSAALDVLTAFRVEVHGTVTAAGVRKPEGTVAVAVDGEALVLPTPVVCELRPRALRVLVPRARPGVVPPPPPLDWRRIIRLAFPEQYGSGPAHRPEPAEDPYRSGA